MINNKIILKFKQFSLLLISAGLMSLLILPGCNDKPTDLGLDLLPPGDRIHPEFMIDSNITTRTIKQEPVISNNRTLLSLGSLNDPVFGITRASFMATFLPDFPKKNFGENPTPDSLILYLSVSDVYGDSTYVPSIEVYRLTQLLQYDTTYTSDMDPTPYLQQLPLPSTVTSWSDSLVKIKLDNGLALELLNIDTVSNSDAAEFLNYFKGLFITAESAVNPGGAVYYMNHLDNISRMTLYYKNSTTDSLSFNYYFGSDLPTMDLYTHDYSNAAFQAELQDTTLSDSLIYVQATNGVCAKINIPGLQTFRESNPGAVSVLKAQLEVQVKPDNQLSSNLPAVPPTMLILTKDSEGNLLNVLDQNSGSTFIDGTYNSDNQSYTFNITRQIQAFLLGRTDATEFYLYPSSNTISANRVVLKANESGRNAGVKFKIIYNKL